MKKIGIRLILGMATYSESTNTLTLNNFSATSDIAIRTGYMSGITDNLAENN